MTTKKATELANSLALGLAVADLTTAINGMVNNDEKAFEQVLNAYRQRDAEDLTGPVETKTKKPAVKKTVKSVGLGITVPAAKKASKPAVKAAPKPAAKKASKPAAKKAAEKAPKGPSRVQRMFEHVLAGLSNTAAVEAIKKEFGKDVPTNTSSIGWCRSQLHAKTDYAKKYNPKGLKVLTDREAQAKTADKK